ncbi:uncharacterized protein METZ01_LOCUS229382, partial [marine metagenome]
GVNVAARIQPLAAPGGICISGAVSDALSSHPDYNIVSKGKQELKHIVQQHSIFELKTGHERKFSVPSKNKRKLENPFIYLPIAAILCVGLYFAYNYLSNSKQGIDNAYLDITSSEKYIDDYYIDYGYGSKHYYTKDKYNVLSISDSLRNHILESVYAMVTSEFSSHKINIEASFNKDEAALLNELYFLKRMDAGDDDFENTKEILNTVGESINNRNSSYNGNFPDALVRVFIYQLHNLDANTNHFIWDKSASWGKTLKKGIPTISWEERAESFGITPVGTDSLIEIISDTVKEQLETIFFAEDKIYEKVGKVIEVLENDMIKIKQDEIGLIKKKMKLSTYRTYFWANGGAEIAIEDLQYAINYLESTNPLTVWENNQLPHDNNLDKTEDYNEQNVKNKIQSHILNLKSGIESIQKAINENSYPEFASTTTQEYSYSMEVVDVIDDIVIAKVIGSNNPKGTFLYRLDDSVILTK